MKTATAIVNNGIKNVKIKLLYKNLREAGMLYSVMINIERKKPLDSFLWN